MEEYIINGVITDKLELNGTINNEIELNGSLKQDELYGVLDPYSSMEAIIEEGAKIIGYLTTNTPILKGEIAIGGTNTYDYYNGAYTVTPRTNEQVLRTGSKLMRDNLTVKEIPYYETSNEDGYTVYIG